MEVNTEACRRVRQRRRDVVAVADKGNGPAAQRAPSFSQCQHVGDDLARMLIVGECVDDVHGAGVAGEQLQGAVRERTDYDRVNPPF
jgi:hypothetical protein